MVLLRLTGYSRYVGLDELIDYISAGCSKCQLGNKKPAPLGHTGSRSNSDKNKIKLGED